MTTPTTSGGSRAGVAIPIRAFALGKARLAGDLPLDEHAERARSWADAVANAAAGHPTVVVSSDVAVRDWATARGVAVLDDPGSLDGAADAGRAWARQEGLARIVIAHADLPRARSFTRVMRDASRSVVALVPCHRDDGTPVLSVPTDLEFRFAYGPGSFRRHAAEARRVGAGLRVVRDADLGFDVDVPADLTTLTVATAQ
jgi:2-phospho-L-lactate/phosphoenolpyruvate guanylyltransferase